jgi:hypothetical protein
VKNLLLTGLTFLSLTLATISHATAESLEPIKSSGNLRETALERNKTPNSPPIPRPSDDNIITKTDCPKPIPGESARSCSTSTSWGTSQKARERARKRAESATHW